MSGKEVFSHIRPKSQEQLRNQVAFVSDSIGESVVQHSTENEIFAMSVQELKERFPHRYDIYVRAIQGKEPRDQDTRKLQVLNALDHYIENHHLDESGQTLRERQINVFEDLRNFIEEGGKEGYIKLPTGAGKTVLFTEFVEATDVKTLIVVPTQLLVKQTEEKFQQFAEDIEVGKVYTGEKDYSKQVTVTTYNSLVSGVKNNTLNPQEYDLLILDEAHRSLSSKRKDSVEKFDNALKIGFTATPKFSQDRQVSSLLNNEIHSISLEEAAREGIVSSFSVWRAETDVDISDVRVTSTGTYDPEDLDRAINIESRNRAAVELYQKHSELNGKTAVAYCNSVSHATNLARQFSEEGVPAAVISGKQSRKAQQELLQKYKTGEIKVLCNADILIEGFDEPQASVCFNLRPTLSPIIAEQRGGRVLRLDENNPDKHAYIIDFVDKTENRRFKPVTFVDVVGTAFIPSRRKDRDNYEPEEYVGTHPTIEIEGLTVITDAAEVLRLAREKHNQVPEVSENELVIHHQILKSLFIGTKARIRDVSREVLEIIREEYPHTIVQRSMDGRVVTAVSDRKLFMDLMNRHGLELRNTEIQVVADSDFVMTQKYISDTFFGDFRTKLKPIVEEVLAEIQEENPDIIVQRVLGKRKRIVSAITDRHLFIQKVVNRGIKLKTPLEKVQDEDFIIGYKQLSEIFIGDWNQKLKQIKDEVMEELMEKDPEIVTQKKQGNITVTVVTDREKFIDMMRDRGVLLKSVIEPIGENGFIISKTSLIELFVGSYDRKLKYIAEEVLEEMKSSNSSSVSHTMSGNHLMQKVSNKDLFIQMMLGRGAKLRIL